MEIRTEGIFQQVTWIVRDFLELPQERGSFLDSPEFHFSGDRYCLRLYPKGEGTDGHRTKFHVRRVGVTLPERKVSCAIGTRRRDTNGDEWYVYWRRSLEENVSYARSSIERSRNVWFPDGSLKVVCKLWLSEESGAGSSARGEEERAGFPGHCDPFSSRWSSTKMELETEFPCTQVTWTVPKVFQLLGEMGDSVTSPEFRFAGDTYCFRFEANGATADTHLELVRLTSTLTDNTVLYKVGGGFSGFVGYPNKSRPLVGSRGFCLSRSNLEEERKKYVSNGTLLLVLFLRLGERGSAGAGTSLPDVEKLQTDLRQLLEKETESDACFVVRGKEFRVHRAILRTRSAVFEAMFNHDTAEKESGRVVVDDLDPDTFGDFLEYLYSGDVQAGLSDDSAIGLYVAADKYNVSTLRSKCVQHMRRTLSVDSFCDVLTLLQRHHEEELMQHATNFFRENLKRIIRTAKWQQFISAYPLSANELFIRAHEPATQ